ncbi:MAG: alpha/beta hydrolase [Chloroflexi bacterium]|nr:alpha/beta hydrolase [Chloroflexota bacterium]
MKNRTGARLPLAAGELLGMTFLAAARLRAGLAARHPPPGRLMDTGGYRLHIDCQGSGEPTVVFEAAVGSPGLSWALVQPEVARHTRACVYDRAGIGWSDRSPQPRTIDIMTAELHALLAAAGIPGPYVLVGYSSGGWQARYFAHTFPQDLAGMVMVDSAHEDQLRRLGAQGAPAQARLIRVLPLIFKTGLPALFYRRLPLPGYGHLPAESLEAYQALFAAKNQFSEAMAAEVEIVWQNMEQVRAAQISSFGDIPLRVLAHDRLDVIPGVRLSPEAGQAWLEMQEELSRLSTNGKLVITRQSGHDILFEQPDLVIEAILDVVQAVRSAAGK